MTVGSPPPAHPRQADRQPLPKGSYRFSLQLQQSSLPPVSVAQWLSATFSCGDLPTPYQATKPLSWDKSPIRWGHLSTWRMHVTSRSCSGNACVAFPRQGHAPETRTIVSAPTKQRKRRRYLPQAACHSHLAVSNLLMPHNYTSSRQPVSQCCCARSGDDRQINRTGKSASTRATMLACGAIAETAVSRPSVASSAR